MCVLKPILDYETAEKLLDKTYEEHPVLLDYVDILSNIIFMNDNHPKLVFLAQKCQKLDKYRPETCCVIGNYYSMKGEREKSVIYFKRALRLNRQYYSAWTLMGHEYLELKNPRAAVNAYRKAVGKGDFVCFLN